MPAQGRHVKLLTLPKDPRFKNLTGNTYGERVVTGFSHQNPKSGNYYWKVKCSCGRKGIVSGVDSCYGGPWPGGRSDSILEKNMSKFKVDDVVKRKDGLPIGNETWGDTVSETAVITKIKDGRIYLEGKGGFYTDWFLELANTSPVRETTVVKKEIVPGTYGDVKVEVWDNVFVFDCAITMGPVNKKDKLAEAIKTLQQIHDAME